MRLWAAQALLVAGLEAEAALLRLSGDENAKVREWAAGPLLRVGVDKEAARAVLLRLLGDEETDVRLSAAQALFWAGVEKEAAQAALLELSARGSVGAAWTLLGADAGAQAARDMLLGVVRQAGAGAPEVAWVLARYLGVTGESPDWLNSDPPLAETVPASSETVPVPGDEEDLEQVLGAALRGDKQAAGRLSARLALADREIIEHLSRALAAQDDLSPLAFGTAKGADSPTLLLECYQRRFEQLSRQKEGGSAQAAEAQVATLALVPDVLLAELADLALDRLAASTHGPLRTRLLALPFDANCPEAAALADLYAALAKGAKASERTIMLRRIEQAASADAPARGPPRSRASQCYCPYLKLKAAVGTRARPPPRCRTRRRPGAQDRRRPRAAAEKGTAYGGGEEADR